MAIHEHIILYGHVLGLREFFEIMTGKTMKQFRSESEVANVLMARYVFDEAHELETWFEKLKYGSLDDNHEGCRFFEGILPTKLQLFELSASQCEDASLAIGYVFYRTDQFTPVYPLEVLRVTPEVVKLSEQLRMAVPHERLRIYLGSSSSPPPSVIMVIDECNCC